jgi:hypothetical protein
MAQAGADVKSWSIDDVANWLHDLSLDSVVPQFKENAVDGKFLLALSNSEMVEDLNLTRLQVRINTEEVAGCRLQVAGCCTSPSSIPKESHIESPPSFLQARKIIISLEALGESPAAGQASAASAAAATPEPPTIAAAPAAPAPLPTAVPELNKVPDLSPEDLAQYATLKSQIQALEQAS